ncbi:TPA: ribonuclease P protein component [Candidatus Latescibacteria bacterium]|nr:ribonuclease P protein component [Candidatus Latescibacterota bacterium]
MGRPNLRLRREVRHLLKSGRIHRGRLVHVRVCESDASITLISIRRKFGNAVKRNSARRRIRDICRASSWLNPPGRLILITVSDRATRATYKQYQEDLTRAFRALSSDTES